jgi:hypothetical protein
MSKNIICHAHCPQGGGGGGITLALIAGGIIALAAAGKGAARSLESAVEIAAITMGATAGLAIAITVTVLVIRARRRAALTAPVRRQIPAPARLAIEAHPDPAADAIMRQFLGEEDPHTKAAPSRPNG